MANTKNPGFTPLGPVNGGGTVAHSRRRVISNNTNAVYRGDACVYTSSGDVVVATSTTAAVGSVCMGASYVDSSGNRVERHNLPAATTYSGSTVDPQNASYLYTVEDPEGTSFEASISTAQALTNLLNNYAMILTTGDTVTGYSKHELDGSTANTTNTLPWRLAEFIYGRGTATGGNDIDAADVHVIVRVNAGYWPVTNTTGT